MRKILITLVLFTVLSCDIVEGPYIKDNNGGTDTGTNQRVLITDATGMYCVFCPAATKTALRIAETNKDRVFMIGIHVSSLAAPREDDDPDLRTEVGNEIYKTFAGGNAPLPFGFVNNTGPNINSKMIAWAQWDEVATELLKGTSPLEIEIDTDYDETTRLLTANINLNYILSSNFNDHLAVYITEDSIFTRQKEGVVTHESYAQRHVLRTSMNGAWGEKLSDTPILSDTKISKTYSMTLPDDWNEKQIRVVAFVHDHNESFDILQVNAKDIFDE